MPVRKPKPAYETLGIKVRSCQRLEKEHNFYKKEVEENEAKLAAMKSENRDKYDIKKFEEVLGESYMMVPDSLARYKTSLEDLSEFIESNLEELEVIVNEGQNSNVEKWLIEAKAMIAAQGEKNKVSDVDITNVDNLAEGEEF